MQKKNLTALHTYSPLDHLSATNNSDFKKTKRTLTRKILKYCHSTRSSDCIKVILLDKQKFLKKINFISSRKLKIILQSLRL